MSLPLQIWSPQFCAAFDRLPKHIQEAIEQKVDEMGRNLGQFSHQRLKGRPEFKLRVGDYRVLYEFDLEQEKVILYYVGNRREVYR